MVTPTAAQRARYAVGPHGSYPIWDQASARSAEALKGKHPTLAAKIDARAKRFGVGPKKKQR